MAQKKMINVRLDPEVWARAKASAGENGTTLERWVTAALESHIERSRTQRDTTVAATSSTDELAWRVAALEQAVDYLAGKLDAGFPTGMGRSAAGESGDR